MELTDQQLEEIREGLDYLCGVWTGDWERLVKEGPCGDEVHTIRGDDLGSATWHLHNICRIIGFGDEPWYYRTDLADFLGLAKR